MRRIFKVLVSVVLSIALLTFAAVPAMAAGTVSPLASWGNNQPN